MEKISTAVLYYSWDVTQAARPYRNPSLTFCAMDRCDASRNNRKSILGIDIRMTRESVHGAIFGRFPFEIGQVPLPSLLVNIRLERNRVLRPVILHRVQVHPWNRSR